MHLITKEVRLLEPVILAPQASVDLVTSNDAVQAVYRKVGGHEYIFAVNTGTEPNDAIITLPRGAASTWHAIGEGRQNQAQGGTLAEQFDVYATHLYTTDGGLAASLSLADMQDELERVRRELHRPGNVAHESTGVRLTSDSHTRPTAPLTRAVNGSRIGVGWYPAAPFVGHWLELAFTKPTTIGRVAAYVQDVPGAEVQVWRDGQWDIVGAMAAEGDAMVARFEPVACTKLRVVITEAGRWASVTEVEAYAK
jgi:hypothetical protein